MRNAPYSPEPLNSFSDLRAIARQEAMAVLQNQSLLSSMIPGSLPQNAVITPFVTALPVTANNGDEIRFLADDTNGIIWHLRYRSNAPSDYRWEYMGGPPLWAEITTNEATTSTSYTALATAGPSVTLPCAGDYMVTIGCGAYDGNSAADASMSYDIGSTGAVDADRVHCTQPNASVASVMFRNSRQKRKTDLAAVTLTAKYKASAGTASFLDRWISITPVRVGRS